MVEETARETAPEIASDAGRPNGRTEGAGGSRRAVRRWSGVCLVSFGVLLLVAFAGIGAGILRLTYGPLRIDGLSERVGAAIAERIGPGWRVTLRDSALELDSEHSLALRVTGLDIVNPQGAAVVRAPLAVVSLDTWGLAHLAVQPRSIEFRDVQMTALVHRDGSIAFAASEAAHPDDTKPHTLPSVDPARGTVSPLSAAVASIFGVVLDSAGVVGALDRARITDARLTLVGEDGRERAVFEHVNGLFGRDPVKDSRLFELRIDGPHGEWRFGGTLREAGGAKRVGVITLDDLPVTDLLLLSGQSKLPVTTDLKVSARADVALDGGRIEDMKATLRTSDGNLLIEQKDFNPVTIESVTASASWDEAGRALKLDALDYRGAGNAVHLTGAWTESPAGSDSDWTATLTGRDATLRGAGPKDAPVKVATLDAHLTGRAGGVAIDDLRMTGPAFGGRITGTIGTTGDEDGLTLHVTASNTELRTGLRLWPEHIAPGARDYLVDGLRGGRLDTVDITVDMSAAELAAATRGDPMPDNAVHIAFAVSDATLTVSPDAPPLSRGRVSGVVTGQSTTIRGVTADIRMEDGRALSISDGSFVIPEITPDKVVAQIGLRLGGGADALAALLQTKLFKSLTGADIDPATIKGSADLRIDFPLNLKRVPDLPDLPVTLAGTLSDLSVDKVMGKDRLETGKFAVSYDRNGFALKGDAKLAGAPVTVDLRQPKAGAPGEVNVSPLADDAFRARKGLPVAPQLSGPIPVKAVIAIGRPGPKAPVRVEADLARAGIDGLVPGLVKAAGKPGKLAFSLVDNGPGNPTELRDIALDAGSASARGSATLNADGGFERAEMTSLKLSPGDDMRVAVDRSGNGYKISVKGAVADARPFLKSLTGPDQKGSKDKDAAPREIDAEVALSILTGFNEEALTNASVKLSLRGRDLRSANIQGRFRTMPFVATVSRGERGTPVLSVESQDAGATLRFVDIYRRMYGGKLAASINLNDGPQTGIVQIRSFALRNEPALSSIVAQGGSGGETVDPTGRRRAVGEGGEVVFDRMRANFVRTGSRVDFRDAAISNAAMGFTLGGYLDTGRERTDINGTFVPLYGLNNVVAQVPIVGQLLGGNHNEGLFAVNFRVSGKLASPDVSVNPLSAMAPGILRKLFSAGGGNDAFADGLPGAPTGER